MGAGFNFVAHGMVRVAGRTFGVMEAHQIVKISVTGIGLLRRLNVVAHGTKRIVVQTLGVMEARQIVMNAAEVGLIR